MPQFCNLFYGVESMKKLLVAALSGTLLVFANASTAGDAAAGKAKSASCAGCHGADGISANPLWPNLKGQKEAYLVKQMKAFRDGTRQDPSMSAMAKPLSDADIENLAAYYSSLK
jgi:cytochrome c553